MPGNTYNLTKEVIKELFQKETIAIKFTDLVVLVKE